MELRSLVSNGDLQAVLGSAANPQLLHRLFADQAVSWCSVRTS